MRVIEQASLWFREGTSDKVYEVDLVEVAANQYVVNFRYGRRGSALRDGTKTATPVDRSKGKTIFDKLVAEKIAGGYRPSGTEAPAAAAAAARASVPTAAAAPAVVRGDHARDLAIIARLQRGWRGDTPLHLAVWAATDRDLTDAEPALLELLDAKPPSKVTNPIAWRHTLVSALVRCGTTAGLPKLEMIVNDLREQPAISNVARLAITRIAPDRAVAIARPLIPRELVGPLERRDAAGLTRAAEQLLSTFPDAAPAAIVGLYLMNDATTRPAVFAIARIARLASAEAQIIRALFRLAELRRDGELYAVVARRIEAHTGGSWSTYYPRGSKAPPMGPRTRSYFRRRVARALRRLARAASPDYVMMAGALLLAYTDADAEPTKRTYATTELYFDAYARYHALNETIYGRSPRYEPAHHTRATWKCRGRYRPGGAAPSVREERFPKLWDETPDALWRVLAGARAAIVAQFAAVALLANRAYTSALSDDALAAVLGGGHPIAQQFAFELALARPMSTALARGGLASDLAAAHAWVLAWIAAHPAEVARDAELLALLVTGKTPAIREAALVVLRTGLAPELAASVAARALAILLGLDGAAVGAAERAAGAVHMILGAPALVAALATVDAQVLRDLIAHPLAALGELAGELMLRHANRDHLPTDLVDALLASPHPTVRLLGGRLLALTPPEIAKDDPDALILFATSANGELRDGTRTLLGEVARRYPEVGRVIADRLVDALLVAQPVGAPAHIVSLLRHELAACLPSKSRAIIMRLIGALSPHAREAGGLLLGQLGPDELGLDDVARLANHEILAIRRGAWALARVSIDRYRVAPVAVSRLVDSAWEDTRAFAIAFIRGELAPLSADAIIAICDSIRPEVQALGTQLLHAQFQTADAGRYLVRFAEHPSVNIQLLVSGLLEHHVAGDLDRVRALLPYLTTVLSQVNRGRVAKERVINLLRREAMRSAEAAAVIAPILDRQSATIAITQKHPLIATMVDVRGAFPDVALPLTITPVPPHPRRAPEGDG